MSAKKFKFVSPGIFLNEIDNSQLPAEPRDIGPVVIGRTQKGPAMRPVQVDSFAEFVEVFGAPHPGGDGTDVWRDGNLLTPTYAAYAAQAWLKNSSTLNVVRLLGKEHAQKANGGEAGWLTSASLGSGSTDGGAYGLWLFPSSSDSQITGTLAATWYMDQGQIGLVGTQPSGGVIAYGKATLIEGDNKYFTAKISGSAKDTTIKFNMSNIRDVFNTNPTLVNSTTTPAASRESYWLGETYENELISGSNYYGIILGIGRNDSDEAKDQHSNRRRTMTNGETGWFIAQDLTVDTASYTPQGQQKLFKFVGLDHGAWVQNNIKISIANVKYSNDRYNEYGSFDVLVRAISDTDKAPVVLERFSNCNLNKSSDDYIANKIGCAYVEFDSTQRRLVEKSMYPNRSKYIRVVMDTATPNKAHLPFGVFGPSKYRDFSWTSGSTSLSPDAGSNKIYAWAGSGSQKITSDEVSMIRGAPTAVTMSFQFPSLRTRLTASSDGLANVTDAFFGAYTGEAEGTSIFNNCVKDLVRTKAENVTEFPTTTTGLHLEPAWVFSLDDMVSLDTDSDFLWQAGLRQGGNSLTAQYGTYKEILDRGIDSFTAVFYGGCDGFDIKEKEPLRTGLLTDNPTEKESYIQNTYKEAIDILADPEVVEYNLATIPGLTHAGLTSHLIETVEARGDAMAIIDLDEDFTPEYEGKTGPVFKTSVTDAIAQLKARGLNSSYACCYYPWVQIRDTVNGNLVYMPPSIAALGAMSYTDRVRAPWFAPAGFNRGGLTSGVAGLPVVNVTQKLTSKDRDKLYDANINPIATFPNEGIVIFGQKTLQVTRSALDRINVRRLLLFVKKGISTISSDILFEPNVQETWDRFINRANPFLADVKARFGLSDYKVVLDSTTTTPDLIDQNVMYAKVFLKPARAIEFIAVDFVITNTGAAFED